MKDSYIQPSSFGIVKLDETTHPSIQGIFFDNKDSMNNNNDIGLLFLNGQKILFINAKYQLSSYGMVNNLEPHLKWLGETYELHLICRSQNHLQSKTYTLTQPYKPPEENALDSFTEKFLKSLDYISFSKRKGFQKHVLEDPQIFINRKGQISNKMPLKDVEIIGNEKNTENKIRKKINYLNYFTGMSERELKEKYFFELASKGMPFNSYILISENFHAPLDLQYNINHWTRLPFLSPVSAAIVRFYHRNFKIYSCYSSSPFFQDLKEKKFMEEATLAFFIELNSHMPIEIICRITPFISEVSSRKKMNFFLDINDVYEKIKNLRDYFLNLLKESTGRITKEAIEAYKSNNLATAETLAQEAFSVIQTVGTEEEIAISLYNFGSILMSSKKHDDAIDVLSASEKIYKTLNNKPEKTTQCAKKISDCKKNKKFQDFNALHQMRPIHEAVKNNDLSEAKTLFEKNPQVFSEKDQYNWCALTYAIFFRVSLELIIFIIEKSPESTKRNYLDLHINNNLDSLSEKSINSTSRKTESSSSTKEHSLVKFALNIPENFQDMVYSWDPETQIQVIEILIKTNPNILVLPTTNNTQSKKIGSNSSGYNEKISPNQKLNDLNYALIKKVDAQVILFLIEKHSQIIEQPDSLITAILFNPNIEIIQKIIETSPETCTQVSKKYCIPAIFSAIYMNLPLPIIDLILKKSPEMALKLTGGYLESYLSQKNLKKDDNDEDQNFDVDFLPDNKNLKKNTTVLIFSLKQKKLEVAELLMTTIPALMALPNELGEKPIDVVKELLKNPYLPREESKKLMAFQKKIYLFELLQKSTPASVQKLTHFQAVVRGMLFRKTNSLAKLKEKNWPNLAKEANDEILKLSNSERYLELSELSTLLHKKSFSGVSTYLKKIKNNSLSQMPDEILLKIMSNLNGVDLIEFLKTSKKHYSLVKEHGEEIWKQKIKTELTENPYWVPNKNYKDLYQRMSLNLPSPQYANPKDKKVPDFCYYQFLKETSQRSLKRTELSNFLYHAINLNAEKWVEKLLKLSAKPKISDFRMAIEKQNPSIINLLTQCAILDEGGRDPLKMSNQTFFHVALQFINIDALNILFERLKSNTSTKIFPRLHYVCAIGNVDSLRAILAENNDDSIINGEDFCGYTPIFWAVIMGNIGVVNELLQHHVRLKLKPHELFDYQHIYSGGEYAVHNSWYIIFLGILFKRFDIVKSLLNFFDITRLSLCDLMIQKTEEAHETFLEFLCARGDLESIQFLLEGFNELPKYNPIVFSVKNGHIACTEYLIKKKFSVNECLSRDYSDGDGESRKMIETPLGMAAEKTDVQSAQCLLNSGANPNQVYTQYYSRKEREPLMVMFSGVPLEKVVENIKNSYFSSKLSLEFKSIQFDLESFQDIKEVQKMVECFRTLLSVTDVKHIQNVFESLGSHALLYREKTYSKDPALILKDDNCKKLIFHFIKMCLDSGANINHFFKPPIFNEKNEFKTTLLHISAKKNNSALLTYWLECGANPTLQDSEGKNPLVLTTDESCRKALEIAILTLAQKNSNQQGEPFFGVEDNISNVLSFSPQSQLSNASNTTNNNALPQKERKKAKEKKK